jgi:hypothetical protein
MLVKHIRNCFGYNVEIGEVFDRMVHGVDPELFPNDMMDQWDL